MSTRRALRVRDLPPRCPDQVFAGGQRLTPKQLALRCRVCAGEWSADPRDYWAATPDTPLVCDDCGGVPLSLGEWLRRWVPYRAEAGE